MNDISQKQILQHEKLRRNLIPTVYMYTLVIMCMQAAIFTVILSFNLFFVADDVCKYT